MAVHAQSNISLNTIPAYTSLLGGHFVYKSSASSSGLTLPSANIIEKLHDNPANWGYNTNIGAGGINLRYNEFVLSQWNTSGLTFYLPKTRQSDGAIIQGPRGLELTQNGITFYNPNTYEADAVLDSNGLTLQKGGIKVGEPNHRGFIYLSSEDYPKGSTEGITINGHSPGNNDAAWRQVIGTKFGVDADGVLYAENAVINGQITIGNHDIDTELNTIQGDLSKIIIYDHTYEFTYAQDDVAQETPISVTFYAHVYKGGEEVTNTYSDRCFSWYYKSEDSLKEIPINNNLNTSTGTYTNAGKQITIGTGPKPQVSGEDVENYLILDDIKYGVEIISKFNVPDSPALATVDSEPLTTTDGRDLLSSINSSNETVRVRDLTHTTLLSPTDSVMVVTSTAEKLVTLENFAAALNVGVSDVRISNNSIVTNGIANIPLATPSINGVMSAEDKAKLDGLPAAFQSDITDVQINGISVVLNGVADIPLATSTVSGAMSAIDKGKLDSIELIMGGTAITAINRLAYNAENTSLQIFDLDTDVLPSPPTAEGIYNLQVSVVNGEHTYSWE